MADIGDISEFLKESSLVDLSWLDVDEEAYRALDRLPKQNLDCVPDLEALWRHENKPPEAYVPNTGAPKTLSDLSQAHSGRTTPAKEIARTARLLIMETTDPTKIANLLRQRYDRDSLLGAREVLSKILPEIGLLGKVYIHSSDFDDCHRGLGVDLAQKYASEARFVVAKIRCSGCIQAKDGHCAVFHKKIVVNVPYTEELAEKVESLQKSKGYQIQASTDSPKSRLRRAYLAKPLVQKGIEADKPMVDTAYFMKPAMPVVAAVQPKVDVTENRNRAMGALRDALETGRLDLKRAQVLLKQATTSTDPIELDAVIKEAEASESPDVSTYCGYTGLL